MSSFKVVDLSQSSTAEESILQASGNGEVNLQLLREQLEEIRDGLMPVIADQTENGGLHLESLELALTVGLEGKIWFVAKGTGEASLTLTWTRSVA